MVDALVVVDSAPGGYESQEFGKAVALIFTTGRQSGTQTAKELLIEHELFKPALERPEMAPRLRWMLDEYSGWHFANPNPVRPPQVPAIQRLDQIGAPTLIIVGERDIPHFCAIADIMARSIPGAKKLVLPGVGHMSPMEDPITFNQVVSRFLAEHTAVG